MLSDIYGHITEVHAHFEQGSFVNGGAEVCSIVLSLSRFAKIVCLRPVKGRYVTVTVEEDWIGFHIWIMAIYSKCKYICSFKC